MVEKYPKKSIRPTPDELNNVELLRKAGVSRTFGGVIHRALDAGFRVLMSERGLIPSKDVIELEEAEA